MVRKTKTTQKPISIQAGQVWSDCNRRANGRRIKILSIDGEVVRGVSTYGSSFKGGRPTRIRINRLKPGTTGYKLVRNVKASNA